MRSNLQPAAPSRRLLRFLQSQSQGIPFFSPHHSPFCCRAHSRRLASNIARSPLDEPKPCPGRRFSTNRTITTVKGLETAPATGAGTLFNVANILPKHLKRIRSTDLGLLPAANIANSRRYASNNDASSSQRLWGPNAVKPDFRSRSTDELEDSIFTADMTGRRAKAALEPVLRCTEVDEKGDAILTDGAFKKSELIAKVSRRQSHRDSC